MGEFGYLIHSRLLFFEGLWTLAPGPDLAVRTAMAGPSPEVVPGAQKWALPWKKWRWAVASFWLPGSKSFISMSAGMCLAKEENPKQSLEESPTPFLCPWSEGYIVSLPPSL